MKSDNIKSGVMLAAIAAAAYVAWQAYRKGSAIGKSVSDLWDAGAQKITQGAAEVESGWANHFVTPYQQGQSWVERGQPVNEPKSFNELMYGNYGYTGQDSSGQTVTDGEWLSDEAARRYSAGQLETRSTPAAQSNNGAAFGVYPSAFGSSNGQGQKGVTGSW